MKALFIGGTGNISSSISRRLLEAGHELWLVNRGNLSERVPEGAVVIRADIRGDEADVAKKLEGQTFDVIADFIAFEPEDLARDYRLFKGRTRQFIYISSASAYQKPLSHYVISEGTPLANPYWEYSRKKIAGEELLMRLYREEGFPVTIVRPSHTYGETQIPLGVDGQCGCYTVIRRMQQGRPVIIHGDGTSLWTLTHSDDFAVGFIGLMGNIHAIGEAVQITGDETLTWNQIYQTIADALGVPLAACHVSTEFLAKSSRTDLWGPLAGDKSNSVVFDNSKLKRLVPGFTAKIRFDQGVRRSLDWLWQHREEQVVDEEFDAWCDRVVAAQERAIREVLGGESH